MNDLFKAWAVPINYGCLLSVSRGLLWARHPAAKSLTRELDEGQAPQRKFRGHPCHSLQGS